MYADPRIGIVSSSQRTGQPSATNSSSAGEINSAGAPGSMRAKTSAEIIREAKLALSANGRGQTTRTVFDSRRPDTPASNASRSLFLRKPSGLERPASAVGMLASLNENTAVQNFDRDLLPERSHSAADMCEGSLTDIDFCRERLRPLSGIRTLLTADEAQVKLDASFQRQAAALKHLQLQPLKLSTTGATNANAANAAAAKRPRSAGSARSQKSFESGYDSSLVSSSGHDSENSLAAAANNNSQEQISPIDEIRALAKGIVVDQETASPQLVDEIIDRLHLILGEIGYSLKSTTVRSMVLKTLLKLLQLNSLTEISLNKLCKLVYLLCKNPQNDIYMSQQPLLDRFLHHLRSVHSVSDISQQVLLFGLGALKFLSSNRVVCGTLVQCSIVGALAKISEAVHENLFAVPPDARMEEINHKHINVQITAIFRNLLDVGQTVRDQIVEQRLLFAFNQMMNVSLDDQELNLNIARILSKLSLYEGCCVAMDGVNGLYYSIIRLLQKYYRKQDITVRLLFVLGNLMTYCTDAQMELFKQPGAFSVLLQIFQHYLELDRHLAGADMSDDESILSTSSSKAVLQTEDLLVKLVRVVANLSAHPEVGIALCSSEDLLNNLLVVLNLKRDNEHILLNALVAMNNLSYYRIDESAIAKYAVTVAEILFQIASMKDERISAEACSSLANLSLGEPVQEWLLANKTQEVFFEIMLNCRSDSKLIATCGVLMNLSANSSQNIGSTVIIRKILNLIEQRGATKDMPVITLMFRLIHNLFVQCDDEIDAETVASLRLQMERLETLAGEWETAAVLERDESVAEFLSADLQPTLEALMNILFE